MRSAAATRRSALWALAVGAGAVAYRAPYVRHSAYSHWIGVRRQLCDRGRVALTFDDGPDPDTTPRLLDTLAELDVPATFFVLAGEAERYPELVRQIVERGHELGSHGFAHIDHKQAWPPAIFADIARARRRLETITGVAPQLYRPPFGNAVLPTHVAAALQGQAMVLWNVDPNDWEEGITPDTVAERVLADVTGGDIVLLHDSTRHFRNAAHAPPALDAVAPIVEGLRARGLTPGKVGGRRGGR